MLLWVSDETLEGDGGALSSTLSFWKGELPRQSHSYSHKQKQHQKSKKGMDDRTYDYDGGGTRKSIMWIIPLVSSTTTSRPEAAQKLQEQNFPG